MTDSVRAVRAEQEEKGRWKIFPWESFHHRLSRFMPLVGMLESPELALRIVGNGLDVLRKVGTGHSLGRFLENCSDDFYFTQQLMYSTLYLYQRAVLTPCGAV